MKSFKEKLLEDSKPALFQFNYSDGTSTQGISQSGDPKPLLKLIPQEKPGKNGKRVKLLHISKVKSFEPEDVLPNVEHYI